MPKMLHTARPSEMRKSELRKSLRTAAGTAMQLLDDDAQQSSHAPHGPAQSTKLASATSVDHHGVRVAIQPRGVPCMCM